MIRDTSLEAYDALDLPSRQQCVLDGLRNYIAMFDKHPTSYELFEFMYADGTAKDLNDVRPRLTDMQGRYVRTLGKRECSVTGRRAYEWGVVAD